MSTTFTWSARLTDAAGKPVPGRVLEVQLFELQANAWAGRSSAKTDADGRAKGSGTIEDDTLPLAPAFRLVEGAALMSVSPTITRAARGGGLAVDFGQVQHLAVEARFAQPRAATTAGLRVESLTVGGIAASETPSTATRDLAERDALLASQARVLAEREAEIVSLREVVAKLDATAARVRSAEESAKTLSARLVQSDKTLAERDAQLADQTGVLAARDAQIAALREAAAKADLSVARAETAEETAQTLSIRLAARDKDLAERDGLLADRARIISDQEAQIAGLRATVAEQEQAIAAAVVKPAVGGKAVGMIDLATTMASQLDDAQTTLKPRGFSLGAIHVTARAVLQDDGGRLELLGKEDLKALPAGSLSDIRMEFIPEEPASTEGGPLVPDVSQLTENAARRILASVGLVLEASVGPRALNPAVAPGQAMVQSPVAGATSARGARVLVIFATDDQQGI